MYIPGCGSYIQWNIYSTIKRHAVAICRNVDGPKDCQYRVKQVRREKQISYNMQTIRRIEKMVQMNLLAKQKSSNRNGK